MRSDIVIVTALVIGNLAMVAERGPLGAASVLTSVAQIRRLTVDQAAQKLPVDVEGVVTHPYLRHSFFLHDGEEGIWVGLKLPLSLAHGQRVRVRGRTGPGEFAPVISEGEAVIIGRGPMPRARPFSGDEANTGSVDSQWLDVEGVVRAVAPCVGERQDLELSTHGLRMRVEVTNCPAESIGRHLVGARVHVRGVAVTYWNSRRQLRRVWLAVPAPSFVIVRAPAPEHTSLPVEDIGSLLRFNPERSPEGLVRIRGVVTCFAPGQFLYVQDETGALRARTPDTTGAAVGDRVDVIGFPAAFEFSPEREDASLATVPGPQALLRVSRLLNPEKVLSPEFHGQLVELEGTLVDQGRQPFEDRLLLQTGGRLFQAVWLSPRLAQSSFRAGSRLRVTGLYVAESSTNGRSELAPQVASFRILLRHPRDLVLLEQPSWWTQQRLWRTVWVLLLVIAGVCGLVVLLGRRVRRQAALLRAKREREVVLEERARIARDLHDTLVQGFVGVSFQLQALLPQLGKAPRETREQAELALNMARHSMTEARRSVLGLRSSCLEGNGLSEAIERSTRQLVAGQSVTLDCRTHGHPRSLSQRTEDELLRLAQEAVANAIQHSGAQQIAVELTFGSSLLTLTVRDNGSGWTQVERQPWEEGHFGILGMSERASRMGGQFQIESHPGHGTCVRVDLPMPLPRPGDESWRSS